MWYKTYEQRLSSWVLLRESADRQPIDSALASIVNWWSRSPWRPYYLHWDDRHSWPDPWQLLAENVYCDVARTLGMLYTVKLLERQDLEPIQMVSSDQGNLVLLQQGKYIMNWNQEMAVNISPNQFQINTVLEPAVLESLTG